MNTLTQIQKAKDMQKHIRADLKFADDLEVIKTKRIENGLDKINEPTSLTRITAAIRNHPGWKKMMQDIIIAKLPSLKDDNRGALFSVAIWVIVSFVTVMFLGLWLFGHSLITSTLQGIVDPPTQNFDLNISGATNQTFGQVQGASTFGLPLIAFAILVTQGFSILLVNYFSRGNPVFFVLHILMAIVTTAFAVLISNTYETLLLNPTFGSTLLTFTASNFIILNLPVWTVTLSLIGALLLFLGTLRNNPSGGLV